MSAVSASGEKPSTLNVPPACAKTPVPPTTGRSSLLWAAYMPAARIVPPGSFAVSSVRTRNGVCEVTLPTATPVPTSARFGRPSCATALRRSSCARCTSPLLGSSFGARSTRTRLLTVFETSRIVMSFDSECRLAWTGTARRRVQRQAIATADLISSHRTRMTTLDEPLASRMSNWQTSPSLLVYSTAKKLARRAADCSADRSGVRSNSTMTSMSSQCLVGGCD